MRQSTFLRFYLTGLVFSLVVGAISFYALRALNESSTGDTRRHMLLFIAQAIETGPYSQTVQDLHSRSGRRMTTTNLWVYSGRGELLASNVEYPPPTLWENLKRPAGVHDIAFHYGPLSLIPDLTVVKLDAKDETYLLIESKKPTNLRSVIWIQTAFFLFVLSVGILIALALIYAYLRGKSKEARQVLARLEKGDLQARFEIKRGDEIGSLMLDFNRMAAEIERLVGRIRETELARKNLLEELSHDLRTPLTSLNTSVETLSDHLDEMPREEQRTFISVVRTELGYFLNLIEDLFFIADLGEPRYKKTTREIDLAELLAGELKGREARQKQFGSKSERELRWVWMCSEALAGQSSILGDPLLVQRLFRNALDNAAKHADTTVSVRLQPSDSAVSICIDDDGPGITDEAIAAFGIRRKNRSPNEAFEHGHLSLGLGSVIMKTILALHGGSCTIERLKNEGLKERGTRLNILLSREGASISFQPTL